MFKKALAAICAVITAVGLIPAWGRGAYAEEQTQSTREYPGISWSTPVIIGESGGYPRMESLPDGTLLLASSSTNKILRLMRSIDGGKSWGQSETIVDYTGTDYLPANSYLYYDNHSETLYFTYRCPIEYKDSDGNVTGYAANINYLTSTDGGYTWSDIKCVCTSYVPNTETYGGMWEPTIYRTGGKLRIYYSSDVVKYGEGQLVLNPGTEYERVDSSYPYSPNKVTQNIVSHELDEETGAWGGGVAALGGYENLEEYGYPEGTVKMRAGMQSISRLSDGTYVMAVETTKFRDWGKYGGTSFPMVIDVCFSRDGVSFTEPRTVAQGHAEGYTSAAPWVVTLPDGRIAVSFQTDDSLSEPHPTEVGAYKQLQVVVSKEAVSYDDHASVSIDDFERYYPFDRYNSDVTYNYWNALFVRGYTLYAVGNHSTNDKSVTAARGLMISTADLTPASSSAVPSGYMPIYTADDLLRLMNRDSGYPWTGKYILMEDIDMAESTIALGQAPIGVSAGSYTSFSGIFDGNGKSIRGLDIQGDGAYTGLFGHTADATVRDLTVYGSISSSYAASARYDNGCGIVGCASAGTWVQNVTGNVSVSAVSTAGGIVGYAHKDINTQRNLIIQNCTNLGRVRSTAASSKGAAGGIVGCTNALIADITIRECRNEGAVSAYRYAGGIVGGTQHDTDSAIKYTKAVRCTNTAAVSSVTNDCGGIFGLAWYASAENCTNYGRTESAVTTRAAYVGGIVGRAHVYVDIITCYSSAEQSPYGCGVLGSGSLGVNVTVTDCYYGCGNADAFSTAVIGEAAGRYASYAGFDFVNTYEIIDNTVCLIDRGVLRMGDVNANKTIDNTDITLLVRYLSGWSESKVNTAYCDLSGDGRISNRDAIALSQKLAGWQ